MLSWYVLLSSKHSLHFSMALHSTKLHTGRGTAAVYLQGWPSSGPVVKGSHYTCLTDGNCWLYWLCSREDELIHHTITSAKIIKNKTDYFQWELPTQPGCGQTGSSGPVGRGLNRYHLPGGEPGHIHYQAIPLWGLWLTKITTDIHKGFMTTMFFTTYFITGKIANNPKIKPLLLKN